MELVRGLRNLVAAPGGCVVAIGNFDGVHLGHQALVREARRRAAELGLPSAVLTFEPYPREFIDPANAPPRLMRLGEKYLALRELHVDRLVVVHFDARLQRLNPDEFVRTVLVDGLRAHYAVVGDDFRYGAKRVGNVASLRAAGAALGLEVATVPAVMLDGEPVSSTRVRAALAAGDLALVRRLLGRDYRLSGRVVQGQRLGRQLGFATANIRPRRVRLPLWGIYAVRVGGIGGVAGGAAHGTDGDTRIGVASLGTRPTVGGIEPLLETHVFDFEGDLYGRRLQIDFVAKLRDEARFDTLDALVAQMHRDAREARAILATRAA